jgi:hypothetical protein
MNLLTTYTHDAELQVITAPSLISTLYKSQRHLLSLFQLVVFSTAIPWQRLLTVDIIQLSALRSFLRRLSFRTTNMYGSQGEYCGRVLGFVSNLRS